MEKFSTSLKIFRTRKIVEKFSTVEKLSVEKLSTPLYIEIKGRNGARPGHCGFTGVQNSKRVTVAVNKSDICTISHISGTYLEESASDSLKAGLYGVSFIMDCNKL